jgi:hypothetical protein
MASLCGVCLVRSLLLLGFRPEVFVRGSSCVVLSLHSAMGMILEILVRNLPT